MPVSQFFVMLESAKRLRVRDAVQDCWTSRAGHLSVDGFESVLRLMDPFSESKPDLSELSKTTIPASSDKARYAVMAAFAADTKINRTVKVH